MDESDVMVSQFDHTPSKILDEMEIEFDGEGSCTMNKVDLLK
jgi:hypothetical protein